MTQPTNFTLRAEALRLAEDYTTSDRNSEYGEPEDSFATIAAIWNWWLAGRDLAAQPITPIDVAEMLDGMKKARRRHNPYHADSYIDTCGYIACAYEIANTIKAED